MSGLVKGIKKVFKKAAKFVKKNFKYIVAAVAIYFTAGVALSYFGSTAAFASSLPGFGTGGIFAKAATWMGFSGSAKVASGLSMTSGAWGGAAGAAFGSTMTAAELAAVQAGTATPFVAAGGQHAVAPLVGPPEALAGAGATGGITSGGAGAVATVSGGAGGEASLSATDALIKAMNTQSKLSMVKMGLDIASGFLAPDPYEEQRKMHALQNAASFGVDREGNSQFGWGGVDLGGAFSNMNKRDDFLPPPDQGSAFAGPQLAPTMHEMRSGEEEFIPPSSAELLYA